MSDMNDRATNFAAMCFGVFVLSAASLLVAFAYRVATDPSLVGQPAAEARP